MKVKAQPGAGKSEFAGVYGDDAIKIRIAAAAVEGAANRELIRFLSKYFKIPKTDIFFKSGESGRIKVLDFPVTERFLDFVKEVERDIDKNIPKTEASNRKGI